MTGDQNLDMVLFGLPGIMLGLGVLIGALASDEKTSGVWMPISMVCMCLALVSFIYSLVGLFAGFVEGVA